MAFEQNFRKSAVAVVVVAVVVVAVVVAVVVVVVVVVDVVAAEKVSRKSHNQMLLKTLTRFISTRPPPTSAPSPLSLSSSLSLPLSLSHSSPRNHHYCHQLFTLLSVYKVPLKRSNSS